MGFRDEQLLIIAPGSQQCLAQLGLPESLTPATHHFRSRMFPAEKAGEFEAVKIRFKDRQPTDAVNGDAPATNGHQGESYEGLDWEEDRISEEGAVWPIKAGRIVDWPCFYALITHVYNTINPPFHTPILLIAEPIWTAKEHERITQFFFERFKCPAFSMMDSALAAQYAYGVPTATVVDVGWHKADVTCITDFILQDVGRGLAVPNLGGDAMTDALVERLSGKKNFTRDMCEQLKKSPICEILGADVGTPEDVVEEPVSNPAAAASTGIEARRQSAVAAGDVPRGPGPGTEVGEEKKLEDEEGVLDIASIVTGGNMQDYLAQKEKERQEKAAAKQAQKKGGDGVGAQASARPVRLPNNKRARNTFMYEDYALHDAMKQQGMSNKNIADMAHAMDEHAPTQEPSSATSERALVEFPVNADGGSNDGRVLRREIEVGPERFQPHSGGILERLADAIFRTVQSSPDVSKRSDLWDSVILVGNGSKVRGFKEALLQAIEKKYLISPSSATIFTSELPSNLSTPMATGANTPLPPMPGQMQPHSSVNPLLHAATTAQMHQQHPHLMPPSVPPAMTPLGPHHHHSSHVSHAQTPTSVKYAKIPEYFPEWKEFGYEEAAFLGAQVAAKVLFVVDGGTSSGFMTRTEYNERGPSGIHDVLL